jgi:RNA recognition motif-containing protein
VVSEAKGTSVAAPVKPATITDNKTTESRHFKTRLARPQQQQSTDSTTTATTKPQVVDEQSSQPHQQQQQTPRPRKVYNENYNAEASIFVGNVKVRPEEAMVRQVFSTYGAIKAVEMARECFFVEFESAESAKKAIQDSSVKFGTETVKVDKRRPPRPPRSDRDHPTTTTPTTTTPMTSNEPTTITGPRPRFQTRNFRQQRPQQQSAQDDTAAAVKEDIKH